MWRKRIQTPQDKRWETEVVNAGVRPMEKDQQPIVNAMLRTMFTKAIFDTIVILLSNKMEIMLGRIKIESDKALSKEREEEIRIKYFEQILSTHEVQSELKSYLSDIQVKRSDILAEILRQHNMDKGAESTYYHDFLQNTFDQQLWKVRMLVKNRNFRTLFN